MADTLISHTGEVLKYIKDYWHLFAGGLATIWGASKMVKINWLRGYATKEEMRLCQIELHSHIDKNRELNTKEHERLYNLVIENIKK